MGPASTFGLPSSRSTYIAASPTLIINLDRFAFVQVAIEADLNVVLGLLLRRGFVLGCIRPLVGFDLHLGLTRFIDFQVLTFGSEIQVHLVVPSVRSLLLRPYLFFRNLNN